MRFKKIARDTWYKMPTLDQLQRQMEKFVGPLDVHDIGDTARRFFTPRGESEPVIAVTLQRREWVVHSEQLKDFLSHHHGTETEPPRYAEGSPEEKDDEREY